MPDIHNNHERCIYCEGEFGTIVTENGLPLTKTRDHIIPSSKGGVTRALNLTYACIDCNGLKSNLTPEEFTQRLYVMIGAIMEGRGRKTRKYPIDRLRTILKNNNKIIDQIAKYKHKLTTPVKKKKPKRQGPVKPAVKKLKPAVKELELKNNQAAEDYVDKLHDMAQPAASIKKLKNTINIMKKLLNYFRLVKKLNNSTIELAWFKIVQGIVDFAVQVQRDGKPRLTKIAVVDMSKEKVIGNFDMVSIWAGVGETNPIQRGKEVKAQNAALKELLTKCLSDLDFTGQQDLMVNIKLALDTFE